MTSEGQADTVQHFAACKDCDLWKFCDDEESAQESVEAHQDQTGHAAYRDTMEARA